MLHFEKRSPNGRHFPGKCHLIQREVKLLFLMPHIQLCDASEFPSCDTNCSHFLKNILFTRIRLFVQYERSRKIIFIFSTHVHKIERSHTLSTYTIIALQRFSNDCFTSRDSAHYDLFSRALFEKKNSRKYFSQIFFDFLRTLTQIILVASFHDKKERNSQSILSKLNLNLKILAANERYFPFQ